MALPDTQNNDLLCTETTKVQAAYILTPCPSTPPLPGVVRLVMCLCDVSAAPATSCCYCYKLQALTATAAAVFSKHDSSDVQTGGPCGIVHETIQSVNSADPHSCQGQLHQLSRLLLNCRNLPLACSSCCCRGQTSNIRSEVWQRLQGQEPAQHTDTIRLSTVVA